MEGEKGEEGHQGGGDEDLEQGMQQMHRLKFGENELKMYT